jgi:hypothetical protein
MAAKSLTKSGVKTSFASKVRRGRIIFGLKVVLEERHEDYSLPFRAAISYSAPPVF